MKFLLDANVGSTVARALSSAGHEVVRIAVVAPAATDDAVLAQAVAEERILITCDHDFGELVYRDGADCPPAIIFIRFEPGDVADIVPRLLPLLDFEMLNNHMTIIGPEHTRRRPFPTKSEAHG